MPYSYTTITLQGLGASTGINGWDQKVFGPFDFDYIATDDIKLIFKEDGDYQSIAIASVDPVTKLVTIVGNNLPFNSSPAVVSGGTEITSGTARIYRSTSLNSIVDFQSGSRISEADLDTAYRQALFASQEAVEDASASGTRTLQATDDIVDGAVTALKLASNAVETAKIKDLNVTVGKLEEDLDLSNNTVILPNNAVTTTKILDANVTFPKLGDVINDNTMATAGATNVATSSSIKAYVDNLKPNIVQAVKTDTYFVTSPQMAFTDIPNLSVTITPKFSNSKILISSSISNSTNNGSHGCIFKYTQNGTDIAVGDTRGARTPCTFSGHSSGQFAPNVNGMDYLIDASSVTAGTPITFKVQVTAYDETDVLINEADTDSDEAYVPTPISTLTVTEIYQ
jgi:hypothetical protein